MISSARKLWLAAAVTLFMLAATSCNDQLRQFIIPVPKPGGDPGTLANSIVLSTNPAASSNGSTMHINVSGDTIVGIVQTGPNPVFFGIGGGRVFVINGNNAGNNTITSYVALLPTTPPFSTVVLPASTSGAIGGGTSSTANFFTANAGSGDSNVISAGLLASVATVTVGTNPVAVAGNSNNAKIYVVNEGTNNVTVVAADNTVIKTIPVGSQPIWAVMSANGGDVFVVNQGSNNVSVIDTGSDSVIATITVGASPNFAFYEPNRQRVYVSNTGESTVSVIKADGIDPNATPPVLPVLLKSVGVSGPPVSVAALADGSKAYAALGDCPAGTNHTNLVTVDPVTSAGPNLPSCNGHQVSVIDANSLLEKKLIPVGAGVVSVATSSNSLRAYAVSAHDTTTIKSNVASPQLPGAGVCTTVASTITCTFSTPSVYDIQTSTDTTIARTTDPSVTSSPVATFVAPSQDPNCTPPIAPKFNTSVPIPCAGQTPFMVRTFP